MDTQAEETFEISVELGNSVLQYLTHRPYGEVAGLIQQLQIAAGISAEKKRNNAASKKVKGE